MNKRQRSKTGMYRLLLAYLESCLPALFLLMPHFTFYFESWKTTITDLFTTIDNQNRNRIGYAASKAGVRQRLIDAIVDKTTILMSFATYADNLILFNLANYKAGILKRCSDEFLISVADIIAGLVNDNLALLADYGVTLASLEEFNQLIRTFIAAKPQPKDQIFNKKESTAAIKTLFATSDATLKKMDGCVRLLTRINSLFKNEYFLRRKLQGPPTIVLAGRGKVKNADGAVMPFVRMTSDSLNINRLVSVKGVFLIPEATEGFHDITFAFPGFQTSNQSVRFYPNIRAEINVIMQPH